MNIALDTSAVKSKMAPAICSILLRPVHPRRVKPPVAWSGPRRCERYRLPPNRELWAFAQGGREIVDARQLFDLT